MNRYEYAEQVSRREVPELSYELTARISNDLRVAANQNTTTEWWEIR